MDAALVFVILTFTISVLGVFAFVVALIQKQVLVPPEAALSLFGKGEEGYPEPDARSKMSEEWRELDQSAKKSIILFFASSLIWLVLGSILGLIASLKLHIPEFLGTQASLTFGILRPLHLNMITYGWLSVAALGVCMWMVPRLTRVPFKNTKIFNIAGVIWNLGVLLGCIGLFFGLNDGLEWLEFWWPFKLFFVVAGAMIGFPILSNIVQSRETHMYVTLWYIIGALIWFPVLFVIVNSHFLHSGIEQATANWWFAHNVLGLWVTPLGLGFIYYIMPKVIGRPIVSYQLSLFGFWGLALFYSQVGMHHLLGGPIPTWLANLSIVMSVGMFIPVTSVAINHHGLAFRNLRVLKDSIVLRFAFFAAIFYTLSSFQGSLHSLRTFNYITHFTHWTVSHAHFGLYGFTSMAIFGAMYFALPRVLGRDFPRPGLVSLHFWLASIGIIIYTVGLGIGGWLQGEALRDVNGTFEASVLVTIPYLVSRSIGGTLMLLSHILMFYNFCSILCTKCKRQGGAK